WVLDRRTQAFKCFLKQLTCLFLLGGVHSPWVDIDGEMGQADGQRLAVIGHRLKIVDDTVRGYRIGKPLNPDPSDLLTADLVFYMRIRFIGDQDFSRGSLAFKARSQIYATANGRVADAVFAAEISDRAIPSVNAHSAG